MLQKPEFLPVAFVWPLCGLCEASVWPLCGLCVGLATRIEEVAALVRIKHTMFAAPEQYPSGNETRLHNVSIYYHHTM